MSDVLAERIEKGLAQSDTAPARLSRQPQTGEADWVSAVAVAVHAAAEPAERHFTLEQLTALARERRARGADFALPGHVAGCMDCLAAFEVVLDGAPRLNRRLLRRYLTVYDRVVGGAGSPAQALRWVGTPLKIAVAALLAAGVAVLAVQFLGARKSVVLESGALAFADGGRPVPARAIPVGRWLAAKTPAKIAFIEGSSVRADAGTTFRFVAAGRSRVAVELRSGQIDVNAAAAAGRPFSVSAPAADADTSGARFTVTAGAPPATALRVIEGDVRMKNDAGAVFVRRGQTGTASSRPSPIRIEAASGPRNP